MGASGDRGRADGDQAILNELVAYLQLAALPADALDPRSRLIMLYAMRLRQFRLARHHDRRALHHVPGEARRGGVAGLEVDRVGDADDVFAGGDRGVLTP